MKLTPKTQLISQGKILLSLSKELLKKWGLNFAPQVKILPLYTHVTKLRTWLKIKIKLLIFHWADCLKTTLNHRRTVKTKCFQLALEALRGPSLPHFTDSLNIYKILAMTRPQLEKLCRTLFRKRNRLSRCWAKPMQTSQMRNLTKSATTQSCLLKNSLEN